MRYTVSELDYVQRPFYGTSTRKDPPIIINTAIHAMSPDIVRLVPDCWLSYHHSVS
jgi:hypothetical protein